MVSRKQVPALILGFFVIDVALGLGYLCNELVGRPVPILTLLLDLDLENNVSSWYSSIQWFMVALFVGLFAHCNFSLAQRKSWLLPSLSLLFLALSLDEIAQIHEWLGQKTDILLSGGSRHNTLLPDTGIWMLVIGVPFAAFFLVLMFSMRTYFQRVPGALVKIFFGMLIMLLGALGFETLTNLVAPGSVYAVFQVFSEELCEMLGGTMVLWGSYELLIMHDFAFSLMPVVFDSPEQAPSCYPPAKGSKRRRALSKPRSRAA